MQEVTVYSDGACKGNPGLGGWGTVLVSGSHEKELFGGETLTTNNRMAEALRIRSELEIRDQPRFNDQAGRYLADTLNQLYAYGTLPNRYVPERQANWEPGANRPVMMHKRSIGGDAWAQTGLLQADIDDGLSKRGPLRLIYAQDGKPQYVTTTAANAPQIPTQRCAGR